jgi:homoserine O-succinyltransferase
MVYTQLPLTYLPFVSNGEAPEDALRILFLNIMPMKQITEEDFCRSLAFSDVSVELLPMKIAGQTYKTTPQEYVDRYYSDFDVYKDGYYDGLILTGAPLESINFEDVRYWEQLKEIMTWAQKHVSSSLYICWGAQAALYHHFGVPKYDLPEKCFGIYPHRVVYNHRLLHNMHPEFMMPNSRHTEVHSSDFPPECQVIAESDETGVGIMVSNEGREVYVVGHLEYEPLTLHNEYMRDLEKGLVIAPPHNYYINNVSDQGVDYVWEGACKQFFCNWLSLCKVMK